MHASFMATNATKAARTNNNDFIVVLVGYQRVENEKLQSTCGYPSAYILEFHLRCPFEFTDHFWLIPLKTRFFTLSLLIGCHLIF
jgi:hypothetical protein